MEDGSAGARCPVASPADHKVYLSTDPVTGHKGTDPVTTPAGADRGTGRTTPGSSSTRPWAGADPVVDKERKRAVLKALKDRTVSYSSYLRLDDILNAQTLQSEKYGFEAHDEMMFIVVHQCYELWFKLILHEIDAVREIFLQNAVEEKQVALACHRLTRVVEIQRLLVSQFNVMETMSPMDFMEFRDFINPASGFQSKQFRMFENRLGLKRNSRIKYSGICYHEALRSTDQAEVLDAETEASVYSLVESWLERMPFVAGSKSSYSFLDVFKDAVVKHFDLQAAVLRESGSDDEESELRECEEAKQNMLSFLDMKKHDEMLAKGMKRLSFKAHVSALMINLYNYEPLFHQPYRLLQLLCEVDELMAQWRYRHALMVHRMIGSKHGTGGSTITSGKDFFNLSGYFLPRTAVPDLPSEVRESVGFHRSS